jgi:hypothetical protein
LRLGGWLDIRLAGSRAVAGAEVEFAPEIEEAAADGELEADIPGGLHECQHSAGEFGVEGAINPANRNFGGPVVGYELLEQPLLRSG